MPISLKITVKGDVPIAEEHCIEPITHANPGDRQPARVFSGAIASAVRKRVAASGPHPPPCVFWDAAFT
ncbi:MAG: hypothetical protein DHS20C01_37640 [marine bacterium B5-7]|nr:MAG: hypothetical protein DHS20C01_37640 [marine bacterium B5-7]